ncbi:MULTISPECIES: hypothetical protein [Aerococcus]|uniref:Uncharacterized protein n=1 Tax=Aerococcus tenax TaxID=3078812 RepID=A0A5N1BPA3_9LACT|nr:hypothetical protein [Aerococcus urinae]KAA9239443.1 hypothetical protein F6I34_06590 [Aerococcus urinae]MDK6370541.1 hypothetical protein [Aerococcus urinae]MDK6596787.1 hypothetical protein [Aerococcus urinae]MDK7302251.1 hypothetical protein [Aerococcus urinae]MDK7800798.1 hypothetical protein [Aerococcus urinae]
MRIGKVLKRIDCDERYVVEKDTGLVHGRVNGYTFLVDMMHLGQQYNIIFHLTKDGQAPDHQELLHNMPKHKKLQNVRVEGNEVTYRARTAFLVQSTVDTLFEMVDLITQELENLSYQDAI